MARKRNKMTTYNANRTSKRQHRKPCKDCPFARTAIPGWFGESTAEEYCDIAHGDHEIGCHVIANQQCAGAAIYRANVIKKVDPPVLILPKDTETVFATPIEFLEHHGKTIADLRKYQMRSLPMVSDEEE